MRSFLEKIITIILLSVGATGIQLLLSKCLMLNDVFDEKLLFALLACLVCDLYQRSRFSKSNCYSMDEHRSLGLIVSISWVVGNYILAFTLYKFVFFVSRRSEIWNYWIMFCLMLLFEWNYVYVFETRAKRAKEDKAQEEQENPKQEN